jgi:hypothetical protein
LFLPVGSSSERRNADDNLSDVLGVGELGAATGQLLRRARHPWKSTPPKVVLADEKPHFLRWSCHHHCRIAIS